MHTTFKSKERTGKQPLIPVSNSARPVWEFVNRFTHPLRAGLRLLAHAEYLRYKLAYSCLGRSAMASLSEYMARYDHEHTNVWNKICHGIGIPLVIAGIVLLLMLRWKIGLALFILGWIFLFGGHRIEGNKPAFFQGVIYFLVGPLWIAKEIKDAIFGGAKCSPSRR